MNFKSILGTGQYLIKTDMSLKVDNSCAAEQLSSKRSKEAKTNYMTETNLYDLQLHEDNKDHCRIKNSGLKEATSSLRQNFRWQNFRKLQHYMCNINTLCYQTKTLRNSL